MQTGAKQNSTNAQPFTTAGFACAAAAASSILIIRTPNVVTLGVLLVLAGILLLSLALRIVLVRKTRFTELT